MLLSNGESLVNVLSVTVLGILIVFSALIILMIVLNLMKLFAPSEKVQAAPVKTETVKEVKIQEPKNENMDEDELIAVLTAAVAASLKTSTYNLRIRSYRRVSDRNSKYVR